MNTFIVKLLILAVVIALSPSIAADELHDAVSSADLNQVIKLVESGSDVNGKDEKGDTPLFLIFNKNHMGVARYLISKGADIHRLDRHGHNLAHEAILHNNKEFLQILIKNGVDLSVKDKKGLTPIDLAKEWGRSDIVNLLANINNK